MWIQLALKLPVSFDKCYYIFKYFSRLNHISKNNNLHKNLQQTTNTTSTKHKIPTPTNLSLSSHQPPSPPLPPVTSGTRVIDWPSRPPAVTSPRSVPANGVTSFALLPSASSRGGCRKIGERRAKWRQRIEHVVGLFTFVVLRFGRRMEVLMLKKLHVFFYWLILREFLF